MEKRLLLVFALTFIVIVLFRPILGKFFPQPQTPPSEIRSQAQPPASPQSIPSQSVITQAPAHELPAAGTKQASSESEIVIENSLYRITFTNRGAQVKSWILKRYDDDAGRPLDLVNKAASDRYGYPLSLWAYDEGLRNRLSSVLYVASKTGAQSAPTDLSFEYADQNLTVRKTIHFDNTYLISVDTSVISNGVPAAALLSWPSGFGDQTTPVAYAAGKIEYQNGGSIERIAYKKVVGGATLHGPFNWIGASDQYFAAVFIPDNPQNTVAVTLHNPIDIPKDPRNPNSDSVKADILGLASGNLSGTTTERVFVGPKDLRTLESISIPTISGAEPDLRALINFGFFQIIARPLFLWLKWTYEHFGHNWGWAIVIQTLIINLALLPLRLSSMRSALKMQKIQPQMNAIKEKYKKYSMRDPRRQEMNTEIGELMKQQGVNPVGGCLPLVIQMPFLFAYYSMLGSAIDLRHAHWLWIHDLSSKDPWLILPIAIIITGLFTQRLTPQAGMDPAQQKMMNFMMPVMFGVISFNLASGLCLYWCEGSLIAIAQQLIMNRTGLGREMRELAEKRARKKEKK